MTVPVRPGIRSAMRFHLHGPNSFTRFVSNWSSPAFQGLLARLKLLLLFAGLAVMGGLISKFTIRYQTLDLLYGFSDEQLSKKLELQARMGRYL